MSSGSPEPIECAGDRLSTPLTTDPKKARALRARTDDDDHPLLDNGKPVTLEDAAVRYDRKMRGEAANKRFGNSHAGKARKNYGRILEADRRLRPNMDDPHLVLISLRGSPCDENGEWLPVLDFLEKLNQSMDNVRRSLNYALQDHESEWCAVLAGNSYYATPHWHYLAWVDGEVDACDFSGVVDSHVRNSPVASEDRHPVEPTVVVASESDMQIEPQNQEDRRRGAVSPLARYVATQLPHINAGDRSEQQRQHGAAMWAYAGQSARLGGLSSSASAPPSPPEPDTSEPNSPGSNSREIEREKSDANSSFAFKKESQKAHADGGERSPGRKDGEPPPPG
ncbi:hypothetical protein BRC90_06535 [Halobacteriales archaeon QS_4_69_34]|nr:MAG: hypothetical protein BRC90_06535 [Halobacteriales archaeon QS_4_69_34]